MAIAKGGDLTCPFTLDTWKGNSKMRPCFAAIRMGQAKMTDNETYEALAEARTDRNGEKKQALMRDAIEVLKATLGNSTEEVNITVAPSLPAEPTEF